MEINEIIAEIEKSRKYRDVDGDVVKRLCAVALKKYPKKKDAVKAVKNDLHIIHGSFLTEHCHETAARMLQSWSGEDLAADCSFAQELLALHLSTRERLPVLEDVCAFLSQYISASSSVADIGCGFNPFTLPFYQELPSVYFAYDMNVEAVRLLNTYFDRLSRPTWQARVLDAVQSTPEGSVDVALLFKLLPLLQQQQKGRPFTLLREMDFRKAVVSFPIKSLSGREKGMEAFYSTFFEQGAAENALTVLTREVIGNELFYVVEK